MCTNVFFMHFVNSVRWHCTILMKFTRLNEDIDGAVRGAFDIRPEWRSKCMTNLKFYGNSLVRGLAASKD